MKKSRRNVKQTRVECDRVSELPDSLILSILELLPMRDVVRTTILSKRWENLWTTVSCLNFEESVMIRDPEGFVKRALELWRGLKILKFKIDFPSEDRSRLLTSRDVDSWVRCAIDHQVEDLSIHLPVKSPFWNWMPHDLHLLKTLSFKCCEFDQLKSLSIHSNFIDGKAINRILCGSPQLEFFSLAFLLNHDNLIIRSSSLKKLLIDTQLNYHLKDSPSTELVIWAPNLETLEMSGIAYPKCLLMDVSSLTHATLGFYGREDEALSQILPKIQHAERLSLVYWPTIKALGAVKKELLPSPFPNVKWLQLNGYFLGFKPVVHLLEMLSAVKTLVLRPKNDVPNHSRARSSLEVERDLPKSFLQQLRTVEVTRTNGDNSIFPLIEFVLKYASNLENMVFQEEM